MLPERQFIAQLRRKVRFRNREIVLGIGDDCAVLRLPRTHEALLTTDFSLEGVHFRRDWQSPECIGHRCLARGLSDIAAMGGSPIAVLLSLGLPQDLPKKWVDRCLFGLLRLARRHKLELAGGDTARSPSGVLADIVVLGSIDRGKALRRSGARVGDQIYVSGELGESSAALELLSAGAVRNRDVFPEPRVHVGRWLQRRAMASAMIDISDGLSTDLWHICEESGTGASLDAAAIPIHPSASRIGKNQRQPRRSGVALDLALYGGEDYELLFTAPKSERVPSRIAGVQITRIGEITRGRNMHLVRNGKRELLLPKGWEHFRRN